MSRVLARPYGPLSAVMLVALTALACDGWIGATLHVATPSGEPVPGAIVCLLADGRRFLQAEVTGPQGCASVGTTVSPWLEHGEVVVWKPGFAPRSFRVETGFDDSRGFRVQLVNTGHPELAVKRISTDRCEVGPGDVPLPEWIEEGRPIPDHVSPTARLENKCRQIPGYEDITR